MDIVKIGSVELTPAEAVKLYENNKYIVTLHAIYQLFWSNAQGRVYGSRVWYDKHARLTRPGRFFALSAAEVNNVLGFELLNV